MAWSPASFAISIAPGERGPYVAHFAQPGTWFGEAAAFTEQPRRIGLAVDAGHGSAASAAARDPRDRRRRPGRLAMVRRSPRSPIIDIAIGAADDLLIRDHVKRSVAVLLRLGGCRYRTPPGPPIEVDVSQEDFAAMTNLARTTAGAVLHKLQAAGHVEVGYRNIRLLAPDPLRAMLTD